MRHRVGDVAPDARGITLAQPAHGDRHGVDFPFQPSSHLLILPRAWIAERLWMGHATRVTQAVRAVGEARRGPLVRMRKKVESIQV